MKVAIVVVAYNAEKTLRSVLDRIQPDMVKKISSVIICDDSSTDDTYNKALEYRHSNTQLPILVVRNPTNQGYGGNQKTGYQIAFDDGADIVVMLHGDGQYAPEILDEMIEPFTDPNVDAVFGSRMMSKGAARQGGMPLYKYYGNKILTRCENLLAGADLSEWHSGYRAYRVSTLKTLPLNRNSDGFDFDTQIILQLLKRNANIVEVAIPTYYGDEICYVDGVTYARQIMVHALKYRFQMMGFGQNTNKSKNDLDAYQRQKSSNSSHGKLLSHISKRPAGLLVDLGCSDGKMSSEFRQCGHTVIGVDIQQIPGVADNVDQFIMADLDQGLPPELQTEIDVVVCADVLEHVREPEELLRELAERLNRGGVVVASIPNFGHWYPRLRTILGLFDYDSRGILDSTHVRFFTRRSFERTALAAGYTVNRIGYTGLPFEVILRGGNSTKVPSILRPIQMIDTFLIKVRPQLFAYQMLYELRP
jgi:glycosyltransferase involved in cell wall biosynthesis